LDCAGFVSAKWQTKAKFPELKKAAGKFMTDPISDMFNRIRNAQAVVKETVDVPMSNIKFEIAKILEAEGYVLKVEKKKKGNLKFFEIGLKYGKDDSGQPKPIISNLKMISKQGQRIYVKSQELKPVLGGYGISIVSTPKGLMTGKEARRQKLGGELIVEIW
jgi:small subunit ribosomal protein S8